MRNLRPRRGRRTVAAIAAGGLLGGVALLVLAAPATADTTTLPTQTFSTAGTYYLTVPGNLDYVDLQGLGGAGFAGDDSSSKSSSGGAGGSGTDVRVTVGDGLGGHQLKIVVGAKGGGGQRGYGSQLSGSGGNGGGATVITDVTAGNLLLVAGGGGGGGGGSGLFIGYDGGNGGTNGNGTPGIGTFGGDAGRGGVAGQVTNCGLSWITPGETGESAPSGSAVAGGGGGGEGACGGGGQGGGSGDHAAGSGGGGGGGAGASYADDFGTNGQIEAGSNSGDGSASVTFTTYVTHSPAITSPSCWYTGDLTQSRDLTQPLTATGYPSPSFSLINAPSWLSIASEAYNVSGNSLATLYATGPAPSPQQYRLQVQATNSVGSIIDPLTLVVGVDHPTFTTASTATATVGKPFSFQATAIGCPPDFGYGLTGLDADTSWLTINPTTGELSGTPGAAALGTHTFTIEATPNVGAPIDQTFTLAVEPGPASRPGAPADVQATAGNGSAVVSFTPPASDGGSAITGYTVTATDHTTAGNGGQTATGSGSPITISGLTNGDSYTFAVTATNSAGDGPASNPSNAVTPATVPGAPAGVQATAGNGSAVVSFTPPASDGGSAISGYTVTATDHTTAGNGGQTATGSGSPITISGLTNGDSYTFAVTANNTVGRSEPSSPSAPVTPAKTTTTVKLSSSDNPVNARQNVTFTATISPADATGAVDFTGPDGAALPGCDTQPFESGVATCDHTFPMAGSYAITATYSGDAVFAGSSGGLTQEVHGVTPPVTTVTVSPSGLSTGPVHVAVSATGDSSGITTRCVLDPARAPRSYADLPSGRCRYLGKGSQVRANGKHIVYAASRDTDGNTEATVRSASFTIDRIAPVSTLHAGPAAVQDGAPLAHVRGEATVRDSRQNKAGTIGTVDCWNSDGVNLSLSATDRGSGVAGLTYDTTGAQASKPTTTGTLPTNLTITKSGLTTATYYATDRAGNAESPAHSETVLAAGGSFACAAATPTRFRMPTSGTVTITGTITIAGKTKHFSNTYGFGPHGAAPLEGLTITTRTLPTATVGASYTTPVHARGGDGGPLVWTLASGSALPPGLHLASDGVISGRPTQAGSYRFWVSVNDPVTAQITLKVVAPPAAHTPPHATGGGQSSSTLSSDRLPQTGPPEQGLLIVGLLLVVGGVATYGATVFGGNVFGGNVFGRTVGRHARA